MNFFDAQDQAKRATRWLVIVYVVSTLLIVAGVTLVVTFGLAGAGASPDPTILGVAALATLALIVGSTLYKTAALSGGGGNVALQMGGTLVPSNTTDLLRQRLRNVVEEMAIASGVPVPEIYVLEEEAGINAFAAGFSPGDAAVAVTRGTLEILNREELQGVIAHEFSHILNGDMRLNIRMMGVLFGIMVVGMIGRTILRSARHTGFSTRKRDSGGGGILMVGLGLTILGWIGVFFSRLIKAAVSRQREFLADASAVQFTRETDGIANALKKIGGYSRHSFVESTDPEEVSHMLFASGIPKLASMFATHPPLTERIQALEPAFREVDYPKVRPGPTSDAVRSEAAAGFAGESPTIQTPATALARDDIAASIGNPTPEHLGLAMELRRSIPEGLQKAAHSPSGAYLLTIALMIDQSHAERQFSIIDSQLGDVRGLQVREYYEQLKLVGPRYWLPLLEISFPELKQRPAESLEFLIDLIRKLIEADGVIDLWELCYSRIIAKHLEQAVAPAAAAKQNRASKKAARHAALDLLRIVAHEGNDDPEAEDKAFRAGARIFGDWAGDIEVSPGDQQSVQRLDAALDVLARINSAGRKSLVEAVTRTITHDDRLTLREAELLRAVCASLECPLPPILSAV
ncbi:MAG: M48 family metallopeptidase [Woeseiaceae bacterium]